MSINGFFMKANDFFILKLKQKTLLHCRIVFTVSCEQKDIVHTHLEIKKQVNKTVNGYQKTFTWKNILGHTNTFLKCVKTKTNHEQIISGIMATYDFVKYWH